MGFLIRLIILALVVYGGWQFWQNYDLEAWYQNCKNAKARTRVCLRLPDQRGAEMKKANVFTIKQDCVFEPQTIHTGVQQRIYWRNETNSAVQIIGGNFQTNLIEPGGTFSKRFDEPMHIDFTCDDGSGEGELEIK